MDLKTTVIKINITKMLRIYTISKKQETQLLNKDEENFTLY